MLLIMLFCSQAFAFRCFWWTVSSGGGIDDTLSADSTCFKRGFTAGQTAIGPVAGRIIVGSGNCGFWNDMFDSVEICINIVDTFWNVGSLGLSESKAMFDGEFILIENCGNCHLNLGLNYEHDLLGWAIGSTPGPNKFTLRAQFTSRPTAPITYSPFRDFVKDEVIWSTENIFGPEGYDVPMNSGINLWFYILMPNTGSIYGDNTIVINLFGKSRLP